MPKRRYLCIQRRPAGPRPQPSQAQMEEMHAVFDIWKEKFKTSILDMGGGLKPDGKVLRASGVTDGPFAEAKEIVGGYMLVSADSFEEALEVARESPGLFMPGASIEIREVA
ncbi:MAG TPA: YciI family protein [Gemmatimonadaceae bacterium]|nr:YciI family protein [Gemmatimonadaceae bacterium]